MSLIPKHDMYNNNLYLPTTMNMDSHTMILNTLWQMIIIWQLIIART